MSATTLKEMMARANAAIDVVSPADAQELPGRDDVVVVDIRETAERQASGSVPGAVHASRGFLEFIADPDGPMHNPALDRDKQIVLFCASGGRSTLAAKTLRDMGFPRVAHIVGGFAAWREAGGEVEKI